MPTPPRADVTFDSARTYEMQLSKMGKDLTRVLGVTSRRIIDRCHREGIPPQNSLTKLGPAVERAIRAWLTATATQRKTYSD